MLRISDGQVVKFAVQYLALFEDWEPVVRYDMAHGAPHRDVLHPNGEKDTRSVQGYDLEEVFEFAIRDVERNWQDYRERYERERGQ